MEIKSSFSETFILPRLIYPLIFNKTRLRREVENCDDIAGLLRAVSRTRAGTCRLSTLCSEHKWQSTPFRGNKVTEQKGGRAVALSLNLSITLARNFYSVMLAGQTAEYFRENGT